MSDLLTDEECKAIVADNETLNEMLQVAARIGAKHEREMAARIAEGIGSNDDYTVEMVARHIATIIRRGDGIVKMDPTDV